MIWKKALTYNHVKKYCFTQNKILREALDAQGNNSR